MRYESIEFCGEAEAEAAIARGDPAELRYVPVAASLHSENLEWAQEICVQLATHPDFTVRGNAILDSAIQRGGFAGWIERASSQWSFRRWLTSTRMLSRKRSTPSMIFSNSSDGTPRLRSKQ